MRFYYRAYQVLTSALFIFLIPGFWIYTRITGRHRRHLEERLGFVPDRAVKQLAGSKKIWIHAVSLGEVKVAAAIIKVLGEIAPGWSFIVSSMTEHGREMAEQTFEKAVPVIYAPVDFWFFVRKALLSIRPDVMVFLETELWPAWIVEAHRMGIKTALINGRISVRSIGGYLKLRPFFREVLRNIDVFSMILEEDGARIRAMGADPGKIRVNGNAKYELLGSSVDKGVEKTMRSILNLDMSQHVFVAGSTRDGEEEMLLNVYEKMLEEFPDTVLIIAPRHIERTSDIEILLKKKGYGYQLRTDLGEKKAQRTEKVIIINTFGELFNIYSIGTIIFCGASLVPLGGQNPLEPAIWGKVVFYGPSMEDFLGATSILEEAGASVPVSDADILAEKAIWFMKNPSELNACGELARSVALKNQGAAEKHARVIKELMDDNGKACL